MFEPRQIYNIAHPFIDSIYLKKEFGYGTQAEGLDILVVETKRAASKEERNQLLLSFLADLDLIRDEVVSKAGKFHRIDIKRC